MVLNQKKTIETELTTLKDEGAISDAEYKLVLARLLADCDTYLSSDKLSCEQISTMADNLVKEFKDIRCSEGLFSIINSTYHTITASNQVQNLFNIGEYCNPTPTIYAWFEASQPMEDKFLSVRRSVKSMVDLAADNKNVRLRQMDSIADYVNTVINGIESNVSDSLLIKKSLAASMELYNAKGLDNIVIESLCDIFRQLSRIGKIDMDSEILAFCNNNLHEPEPLTYEQLVAMVGKRLDWMLEERLIGKSDHNLMKATMLDDINTFLKGSQTKEQLTERAKQSLDRLKKIELETEDREFVAETYYDIAQRCDVDIAQMLNKWLYGF
ncbi:hypothetical protein D0T57_01540 [Dysgonomonas sp. 511]|nr:hypothetical protein [Dysgonomonas sp. 511]